MKPTTIFQLPSILVLPYTVITISTFLPTDVNVQASSVSKIWKKIEFFTSSGDSVIDETTKNDAIQPSPVVEEDFVCPTIQDGVLCTTDWFPVVCGPNNCEYSNDCVAWNSGFNVTTDCQPAESTVEEAFACPTLQADKFCDEHWDPYECGENKCLYSNDCYAEGSGYNISTNCTYIATPPPTPSPILLVTTNDVSDCPVLAPDRFCEEIWEPVLCAGICQYSNACYASGSGFDVTANCTLV